MHKSNFADHLQVIQPSVLVSSMLKYFLIVIQTRQHESQVTGINESLPINLVSTFFIYLISLVSYPNIISMIFNSNNNNDTACNNNTNNDKYDNNNNSAKGMINISIILL